MVIDSDQNAQRMFGGRLVESSLYGLALVGWRGAVEDYDTPHISDHDLR